MGTGIDFGDNEQIAMLQSWLGKYQALFDELRADPQINTQDMGCDYLHNGMYATPDAEVYAAMIAERVPSRIVEVGAGYSTRIARRTIEHLNLDTELVVVDPQPRADVSGYADMILQQRVEDVDLKVLSGTDGTFLFVDSSHIVRAEGDVPLLFCSVIPALPAGVTVHVHDVFLPYDYPPAYRRRLYGEQYVLWALLARSPEFKVLMTTHYMVRTQGSLMRQVFGPIVGRNHHYYGGSLWFEVV